MREKMKELMRINALLRGCFLGSLIVIGVFITLCIHFATGQCKAEAKIQELKDIYELKVIEYKVEDMSNIVLTPLPKEVINEQF